MQRQYTGTAGRIENAQVAVFLAYASSRGYTLIDREVYLPRCWTDDPARCAAAGIPEQVRFATKITLARRMLTRAREAGTPAAWCTADEFYGGDRGLRRDLQAHGMGYVLAVARNHRVTTSPALGPQRVDQVVAALSRRAWNRYSAGDGAKGAREYDWAWISINAPDDEQAGYHCLLIRRRLTDGELAFYRCWSPTPAGLPTLVRVAGTRWCVETCFKSSKNATGLDEHQVRRWDSWHRYTTLVMLAHAILTAIAAREQTSPRPPDQRLIPLTVNEIRRLFARTIANATHTTTYCLAWSRWRRLHQARAKTSHYRRRGQLVDRPVST